MKEFLLVYRAEKTNWTGFAHITEEEAQARTKKWMDWIGGVAAQNKLVSTGSRLFHHGKVVNANGLVTDGPYAEIKETIGGYSIVRAASYSEAADLAKGCPALALGGNVEIREINTLSPSR